MTLNNGAETAFVLGTALPVEITWTVNGFPTIEFYLNECSITHGATVIKIISDGCYSEEIGVSAGDATATSASFSFTTFTGFEETAEDQTIDCSVKLCEVGHSKKPTSDSQCPNTADAVFYNYSVTGV